MLKSLPSWIAFVLIGLAVLPHIKQLQVGYSEPIKIDLKPGQSAILPDGTTHIHIHALRLYKETDITSTGFTRAKGRFITKDKLHESAFATPEIMFTWDSPNAKVSHAFELVRVPPNLSKEPQVEFFLDDLCISRFHMGNFRFSDLYIRGKLGAEFYAVSHPTDPEAWLNTITQIATGLLFFGIIFYTCRAFKNSRVLSFSFFSTLFFAASMIACYNPLWVFPHTEDPDYAEFIGNLLIDGIVHVGLLYQFLLIIFPRPSRSGSFQFLAILMVIFIFIHGVVKVTANQGLLHNRTLTIEEEHIDDFITPVFAAKKVISKIVTIVEVLIGSIALLKGIKTMTLGQVEFMGLSVFFIRYIFMKETSSYKGEFVWFNDWQRLFQGVFPVLFILSALRAVTDNKEVALKDDNDSKDTKKHNHQDEDETETLKEASTKQKKQPKQTNKSK